MTFGTTAGRSRIEPGLLASRLVHATVLHPRHCDVDGSHRLDLSLSRVPLRVARRCPSSSRSHRNSARYAPASRPERPSGRLASLFTTLSQHRGPFLTGAQTPAARLGFQRGRYVAPADEWMIHNFRSCPFVRAATRSFELPSDEIGFECHSCEDVCPPRELVPARPRPPALPRSSHV